MHLHTLNHGFFHAKLTSSSSPKFFRTQTLTELICTAQPTRHPAKLRDSKRVPNPQPKQATRVARQDEVESPSPKTAR